MLCDGKRHCPNGEDENEVFFSLHSLSINCGLRLEKSRVMLVFCLNGVFFHFSRLFSLLGHVHVSQADSALHWHLWADDSKMDASGAIDPTRGPHSRNSNLLSILQTAMPYSRIQRCLYSTCIVGSSAAAGWERAPLQISRPNRN